MPTPGKELKEKRRFAKASGATREMKKRLGKKRKAGRGAAAGARLGSVGRRKK